MDNQTTKVITGEVRLNFVHLFEPHAQEADQTPKYSVMLLIPKKDTKTVNAIKAAQKAALEKGKNSKFNGKIPNNWSNTLRDGDNDDAADVEKYPEYKDHYFMTVSSNTNFPPGLVDQNVQAIMDRTELYSGVYARVAINAFPYSTQGNKGVSFGLNNVQKLRDGEPLGGAPTRPEDDFEAVGSADEESLI